MGAAIFLLIMALLVGVVWYVRFVKRGIQMRYAVTRLKGPEIRKAFENAVTGVAWKIIEEDETHIIARGGRSNWWIVLPIIGYLIGGKQSITCVWKEGANEEDTTELSVGITEHWEGRWFSSMPIKGHTLRVRMNRFQRAVSDLDPSAKWAKTDRY